MTTGDLASDDLTVQFPICVAPDGENAVLADDFLFGELSVTVCEVIEVGPDYVVGVGGVLTLRAGEMVMFLNGTAVEDSGEMSIGLDPDLVP